MPLADLYGRPLERHRRGVPDETTPDEAVYLPGRNALLLLKAAVWCQLHGIERAGAGAAGRQSVRRRHRRILRGFQTALNRTARHPLASCGRSLASTSGDVMELGRASAAGADVLVHRPVGELHCGHCNKCAERQAAFRSIGLADRTTYALANGKSQRDKLLRE